jgi:hypothetical protein
MARQSCHEITALQLRFRATASDQDRPALLSELSYFRAAICRNHPKIVPGFTSWQHFFRSSGRKALPATASRRR